MAVPVLVGPVASRVAVLAGEAVASAAAGYVLDAVFDQVLGFNDPDPNVPIPQKTTQDIVNNITVSPSINVSPDIQAAGGEALNEISNRDAAAVTALEARFDSLGLGQPTAEQNARIAAWSEGDRVSMRKAGVGDTVDKSNMPQGAKNQFNKARRKDSDGARVSKEEHEFRYSRDKGQIQIVFDKSIETAPSVFTYGAWVDSGKMRKAIALYRRLRRIYFAANLKFAAEALGTTRAAMLDTALEDAALEITWNEAAAEFLANTPDQFV